MELKRVMVYDIDSKYREFVIDILLCFVNSVNLWELSNSIYFDVIR